MTAAAEPDLQVVSVLNASLKEACKDYVVDVSKPTFEIPSAYGPMLFRISKQSDGYIAYQIYDNGWPKFRVKT